MKITVLTWCVSFLPILLLIMLLAVFHISTARAAGVTLLLTVLSALFHLCDLPHFFKGERRHMVIFVHNDHPIFLCKGLAPPPNRECSCSIRVYSFPLYGILCPYSTPSLDAAFAERIVIFAPPLFLSGIPDISSKSNPVI